MSEFQLTHEKLWELTPDKAWELLKVSGSTVITLTKTGKQKTVTTKVKKGLNGNYITFDGAEYLSLMKEYEQVKILAALFNLPNVNL